MTKLFQCEKEICLAIEMKFLLIWFEINFCKGNYIDFEVEVVVPPEWSYERTYLGHTQGSL